MASIDEKVKEAISKSRNSEEAEAAVKLLRKDSGGITSDDAISIIAKHGKKGSTTNFGGSLTKSLGPGFVDMNAGDSNRLTPSDIIGPLESSITGLGKVLKGDIFSGIGDILKGGADALSKILDDMGSTQAELIKNVKGTAGYVGQMGDVMIHEIRESLPDAVALGAKVNDILEGTKSLMKDSGTMSLYSQQTISEGVKASLAFTDSSRTLLENAQKYRDVGISFADASKVINKVGLESVSLGLNAKQVTKTINENIQSLNAVGFKNGIEGLSKMVQQAQAINFDIRETTKLADKLFDPSAAIDMTARLQAIGGAMGSLNDPLRMMYDATNNVEDLQTSILDAAKSLATYNSEQGRFEVTGVNLRRAKEMSNALGISMEQLTSSAIKGSVRMEAMSKIQMFPNITKEQKEFVANLSTMKDGRVGFDVPKDIAQKIFGPNADSGFRSMEEMQGHMDEFVKMQQEIAKEKPEDIARQQLNTDTQMLSVLQAMYLRGTNELLYSKVGKGVIAGKRELSDQLYNAGKEENFKPGATTLKMAENIINGSVIDGIISKIRTANNNESTTTTNTSTKTSENQQTKNTSTKTSENQQTKVIIEMRNLDPNTKLTERSDARDYTSKPITVVGVK